MSPRPISKLVAYDRAAALVREHRPRYTSTELGYLLDPLAAALRAGLDPELALDLVRGAESAYHSAQWRADHEREQRELARRIAEGRA